MKKIQFIIILLLLEFNFSASATKPFRFALFTDLHISATLPQHSEDLQLAVIDVNALRGIDFVIISGDVSDKGDTLSLRMAKQMLQKLRMPYYIIPGNHDVKWYHTGSVNFDAVFGDTKFDFTHNEVEFIGFTTAPLSNKGVGFIQPVDIQWIKTVLQKTGTDNPVILVTHYPLQTGDVDNWKDIVNIAKKYSVQAVLGGHYHRNAIFNYDGIPGIISRTIMRGNDPVGGYSVFSISDSIRTYEKRIGQPEEKWLTLPFESKKNSH